MKKSKLITCLSAAFVSAMALMSCSSLIKPNGDIVLTINGEPYTAEELFNDQKTPAAAEAKFNAVYKVAIRAYFKNHTEDKDEIERNTKIKINEQKATAQSNADKNGTSYGEEWQKILDSNGVENEDGLYHKFEYELQKEKFETKFYDAHYDELRSGNFPGADKDPRLATFKNYFDSKQPYHMKHILVKVSASGDDSATGTITEDEAKRLHDVIVSLAAGDKTFDGVSSLYSQDETAKKDHASLGIMSRDTSFVDDFKLGTYLYESYYGSSTVNPDATKYKAKKAKDAFFPEIGDDTWAEKINTEIIDKTSNMTLGVIPYEAALALGENDYTVPNRTGNGKGLARFDYDDQKLLKQAGIGKDQFKDKYLPRNIIFNKYFNKHNIMVIAPMTLPSYDVKTIYGEGGYVEDDGEGSKRTSKLDTYTGTYVGDWVSSEQDKLLGFGRTPKNDDVIPNYDGSHNTVLRDENGRVILVFRSGTGGSSSNDDGYQGIHFVVIERSPFIGLEYDDPTDVKKTTDIDEYYTQYYPEQTGIGDKHHPTYNEYIPHPGPEEKNDWKHTFVNYIMEDVESKNKKERADTVKSELKKCDDLNTYLYEYLVSENIIKFSERGQEISKSINDWIDINHEDKEFQNKKSWKENWQKFYYSLKAKQDERKEYVVGTNPVVSRLVPEACSIVLTQYTTEGTPGYDAIENLQHLFGVGGVWHE